NGTFALALRPIQVNPPWQFLNTPGGAARVDSIFWIRNVLRANTLRIRPLTEGAAVGTTEFDAGEASSWIQDGLVPPGVETWDSRGLASAVMSWEVNLAPGDSTDIVVASRLDGTGDPLLVPMGNPASVRTATNARLNQVARTWARDQDAVTIKLPASAPPIVEAIKANLAWILINRDGPGIQPGSRSYERSWIRDGSLTAEALLRLGRATEAKQFAEWYAKFQYPSGKIPCCVDSRGADPVDEHDSHGEFIHLVYEVYKYTGDREFLTRMYPHVKRATVYMDSLRATHLTAAYEKDSLRAFRGLLPASISHEGYSAKPMHSVWDDGFALLGYREAWELANTLGRYRDTTSIGKSLRAFAQDFAIALNGTMERNRINFIPGSIELADFDATSTTALLSPGNATGMSGDQLRATFDRYYQSSRNRTRPDSLWENYTPYEWRTVGALLRLGKRTEAIDMLNQFMHDRRPTNWQQWAEVVWRDPRNPKFIGDMPHTWVGSDFIRSALDLFAYANPCAGPEVTMFGAPTYTPIPCQLRIGLGIDGSWLSNGDSIVVRGLRTGGETVGYTVALTGKTLTYRFDNVRRRAEMVVVAPVGMNALRAEVDGVSVPNLVDDAVVVRGNAREVKFFLR
ncbi:MAG: carbohydrate-binding protein, partial [Gemmatimonadaceae bacterium]